MRAVVHRVLSARVEVAGAVIGAIGPGLLVYLGVGRKDGQQEPPWMARKIAGLRIFSDEKDRMSLSALDRRAPVLVVSQFTLYGDVRKGRRPSFDAAAEPEQAERLYIETCQKMQEVGLQVETGRFRSHMIVHAVVDGPVTILIDSAREF